MKFPKLHYIPTLAIAISLLVFSYPLWGKSFAGPGVEFSEETKPAFLLTKTKKQGILESATASLTLTHSGTSDVFCNPNPVVFTVAAQESVTLFNFYVNGTSVQNTASPTFTYSHTGNAGTVSISVVASLQAGGTAQQSTVLYYNILDPGTIGSNADVCLGDIPNLLTNIAQVYLLTCLCSLHQSRKVKFDVLLSRNTVGRICTWNQSTIFFF